MASRLKPGRELTRAFDERLLARYYDSAKQGSRQNLSNGDPLQIPFEPIRKAIASAMRGSEMALYTRGGGPKQYRDKVIPYCESMGLSPSGKPLSYENITFGIGSTYLYNTILKILGERSRETYPGKTPVLIMPAPTYGIFTMQPVSHGFDIETFDLSPKNNWQMSPQVLSQKILEINAEPDRYVAALYHANPHNPTGAVANGEQTQQIARVLKKHGVFAIDDLAYSGIEHNDKAVPISAHNFGNGVTLLSLSKAYCLPRARSGVACGPSWLIEAIDAHTDMSMISLPAAVFAGAAACFASENREEREELYLPANSETYMKQYQVLQALIHGIDNVPHMTALRRREITQAAEQAYGSLPKAKMVLKSGMDGLELINDTPQAGYFSMIRIRGLDDMFYGTTRLSSSFQFAAAAVDIGKVLTLPLGFTLAQDTYDDVVRVSFGGMQDKTLIRAISGIVQTTQQLPRKPDPVQEVSLRKAGCSVAEGFTLRA